MMRAALLAFVLFAAACGAAPRAPEAEPPAGRAGTAERGGVASAAALSFLASRLRPWPGSDGAELVVTEPRTGRVAVYDSALTVLVLLRTGQRDRAARVLGGLAALQSEDGALPFSFVLPSPGSDPYVRSGAVAWVGYAAVEWLDAQAGGAATERERVVRLAHRAASYLLERQVQDPGDPRDGLVRGGSGTFRYDVSASGEIIETFVPGELAWTSTEHNVDAFFFLRGLARITGGPRYAEAASRIRRALAARAVDDASGQLVAGIAEGGPDRVLPLDCSSWGSLFLRAAGDAARADTAAAVADGRYATRDRSTGARGHRPFARGPLIESVALRRALAAKLPAETWDALEVVWPEGSAGVALAALRAGRTERARAILADLEPLRAEDGSLPTATIDVPYVLDRAPSVASTAWALLVEMELRRAASDQTLLAP